MHDLVPIRRALISVSDKADLAPFASALIRRGVTIISTGGTARTLSAAGIPVTPIEDLTGFPEILDGRVKTLHPAVHAALLAKRDDEAHMKTIADLSIVPIDLVCINLYPFERAIRTADLSREAIIEQMDIGGPAMIRSAAKNHDAVTVVTSSAQYDRVITQLDTHDGCTTRAFRTSLAAAAFSRTAEYDATISAWMHHHSTAPFPDVMRMSYTKVDDLRYGENPHQQAALYRDPAWVGQTVVNAQVLHGKALSFNNLADADAALALVQDLPEPAAAIIKHLNPCGAATAESLTAAFDKAHEGDPLAAFGGIVAFNMTVDRETAQHIAAGQKFFEVIVAPAYQSEALTILKQRWTNVRLLAVGSARPSKFPTVQFRSLPGGLLAQQEDRAPMSAEHWQHVAGPEPTRAQLDDALFMNVIAKHLKSNAIAIGSDRTLHGAGAGQMDRVASCRIALGKAGKKAVGATAASDAFFPFPDGPTILIDAGVKCIVEPGGSKRDQETVDLCAARDVTLLFTGQRHFRH